MEKRWLVCEICGEEFFDEEKDEGENACEDCYAKSWGVSKEGEEVSE